MKVTVIKIVISALGMVRKALEERLVKKKLRERIDTILTTALIG